MTDVLTKSQRSKNMAAIKSKRNKSTEESFLRILKQNKITGWRRNYKRCKGTPDFVFLNKKIVVFIDGCFWHGCTKHGTIPATQRSFWQKKLCRNKKRDKEINSYYKKIGWKVSRFWEHELKKDDSKAIIKIKKLLMIFP